LIKDSKLIKIFKALRHLLKNKTGTLLGIETFNNVPGNFLLCTVDLQDRCGLLNAVDIRCEWFTFRVQPVTPLLPQLLVQASRDKVTQTIVMELNKTSAVINRQRP
jgi:hypothetical protein